MRTKNFTKDQINEIIKLYVVDRLSTIEIGKKFNIGKKAINHLLRKNNVVLRTAVEGRYKGGKKLSNKKYREKDGYSEKQKEYMKNYMPTYVEKNKEKIKEYREKYKTRRNEIHQEKMKNNPLYKLKHNIRGLIKQGFKKTKYFKNSKTQTILGCSFEEFKKHIEVLWSHPNNLDQNGNIWMNWENMGNPKDGIFEPNKTWDIDHIIPSSSALTEDDVIRLNHYTNLQPLCSYKNRFIKRNTE